MLTCYLKKYDGFIYVRDAFFTKFKDITIIPSALRCIRKLAQKIDKLVTTFELSFQIRLVQ